MILRQGELLAELLELDLTVVLVVVGYPLVTGFDVVFWVTLELYGVVVLLIAFEVVFCVVEEYVATVELDTSVTLASTHCEYWRGPSMVAPAKNHIAYKFILPFAFPS